MADDPNDVIMPMLREMHAEMRQQFSSIQERFLDVNQQLEKLESGQKTIRQALTGRIR